MKLLFLLYLFYLICLKIEANVKVFSCYDPELKETTEEIVRLTIHFCDDLKPQTVCDQCNGDLCAMPKGKLTRMKFSFRPAHNATINSELDLSFVMQVGKNRMRISLPQLNKNISQLFDMDDKHKPSSNIYTTELYALKNDFLIPSLVRSGDFNLTMTIMSSEEAVRISCGIVRGSFK